jgi:hypothetical protein|uniref:Uncharacterized protein n=1 Tax=viral metagenome TaxID=1070528 RepID=A0A6C0IUF9_9ZZZZ
MSKPIDGHDVIKSVILMKTGELYLRCKKLESEFDPVIGTDIFDSFLNQAITLTNELECPIGYHKYAGFNPRTFQSELERLCMTNLEVACEILELLKQFE